MNRKENNCRCCFCCCENNKNDWDCGHEKEYKKYCFCEREKEFPKHGCSQEKDFSKCGCSHDKCQNKNYDYGFENKSKYENSCGCGKSNYGYEKYNQNNFGWY